MLRPLHDQVVVEPLKAKETNVAGLLIPDAARAKYHGLRALVVAVGPGNWTLQGTRLPIELNVGDVVILRSAGPLIEQGDRVFSIVSERDIMAVVGDADEGQAHVRRFTNAEYVGLSN